VVLPPRELLFRLVLWTAVFVWAIWKMQDFAMQDVAVPDFLGLPLVATEPVAIPLPAPAASPGEPPADLVDPAAAVAAMDAVAKAGAACGVAGELTVTLGPAGPVAAFLDAKGAPVDAAALACLGTAVSAGAWPRSALTFELSGALSPTAAP